MATGLQTKHGNILQEAFKNGLQSFVNTTTNTLAATSTAGTPAAGTFYSTVSGRASVTDISQDLKASFGIERIMVQQIVQLQNEFGPNGEPAWSAVNDDRGLIRFVGNWTNNPGNATGPLILASTLGTDFIEITFYGTGLNLLLDVDSTARPFTYSVDGGTASSGTTPAGSSILAARNYSPNQITQIISGLALNVHTVKFVSTGTTGNTVFFGFEILNANSTTSLNVNPGIAYADGLKIVSSAAQSIAYNSSFETGTLGTRGGHVVAYLKQDGTVGKAVTPVNAASAFLTSADHTNEEIVRTYFPSEFGAGRADDWSLNAGSNILRAFTLDDGTTSLVGGLSQIGPSSGSRVGIYFVINQLITFTFVGTGLDFEMITGPGETSVYSITVDGVTAGNLSYTAPVSGSLTKTYRIVSGLPYGTHTVRVLPGINAPSSNVLSKYIIYQPKKPSVLAGSIELADYNVMATYAADTTATTDTVSSGVLFKQTARETIFTGAWGVLSTSAVTNGVPGGWYSLTTSAAAVQYTFFGTGIEIIGSGGGSNTIKIDGVNYTGAATAAGTTTSWTPGSSTWVTGAANGNKLQINGLALSVHTVTVTWVSGTFFFHGFSIITPIHSAKSNTNYDAQNTLPVGSCSLSDNRKTSLIKDAGLQKKNIMKAVGISSSPTTTSSSAVPIPDMSGVFLSTGGFVEINLSFTYYGTANPIFSIYVNGAQVDQESYGASTGSQMLSMKTAIVYLPAGSHKIDAYWRSAAGGTVVNLGGPSGTDRILTAKQL